MEWSLVLPSVIAVVGLSEYLKSFDKQTKLKKFYSLLPLALSILTGIVITNMQLDTFSIWPFLLNILTILGISIVGYEAIIKLVYSKIEALLKE